MGALSCLLDTRVDPMAHSSCLCVRFINNHYSPLCQVVTAKGDFYSKTGSFSAVDTSI
jgi:hypothetical protein